MAKILIIEDSSVARTLLGEILCEEHELEMQNDGPSGLTAAQTGCPDLILLDIHLPGMSGYEICRILKGGEKTRDVPIIFITSLHSEEEKVKGFEAGAEDYVVKPFYRLELMARIKTQLALLKARQQALAIERLTTFKELAVAISHELNNPLTSIFALLHHLQAELANAPPSVTIPLDCISNDITRIQNITKNLAVAAKAPKTRYNKNVAMIDLHNI